MNKGFIALIIVLSVTTILLGLVIASSIESGLFFDQAVRKEYREMNYYYAYDCLDQAILSLAHDYFFEVTEPIEIPKYHCSIHSIIKNGEIRFISTRGNFNNIYVYRHATVLMKDQRLEITSLD